MGIRFSVVILFGLISSVLMSCGGGSCGDPNDPSATESLAEQNCEPNGLSASAAASVSLTNALTFNNAGAVFIEGEFPGETSAASPQGEVSLAPGGGNHGLHPRGESR